MAAYDMLLNLVREYFVELGYNPQFVQDYFSNTTFKEIAFIRLANANIMIKNKSDHTSHQTHIAVTGEMIEFFYNLDYFASMDNTTIEYRDILLCEDNIALLKDAHHGVKDAFKLSTIEGKVSIGKRTQKQVQLSKTNRNNSQSFNELRLGLFENDLLIMMKYRKDNKILCIGIPQIFYLDIIPNYADRYETNTYLRMALPH